MEVAVFLAAMTDAAAIISSGFSCFFAAVETMVPAVEAVAAAVSLLQTKRVLRHPFYSSGPNGFCSRQRKISAFFRLSHRIK